MAKVTITIEDKDVPVDGSNATIRAVFDPPVNKRQKPEDMTEAQIIGFTMLSAATEGAEFTVKHGSE